MNPAEGRDALCQRNGFSLSYYLPAAYNSDGNRINAICSSVGATDGGVIQH